MPAHGCNCVKLLSECCPPQHLPGQHAADATKMASGLAYGQTRIEYKVAGVGTRAKEECTGWQRPARSGAGVFWSCTFTSGAVLSVSRFPLIGLPFTAVLTTTLRYPSLTMCPKCTVLLITTSSCTSIALSAVHTVLTAKIWASATSGACLWRGKDDDKVPAT